VEGYFYKQERPFSANNFNLQFFQLQNGTLSAQLAEEALFSRHPVMKKWPKGT
jgi:hypothetical protein